MSFFAQKTMRGYMMGEVISALQKAIRRSDEKQAVWWAVELEQSGFGSVLWGRLELILSEDIGPAWVNGPSVIAALRASYDRCLSRKATNEAWRLYMVHAVMLMANAKKSRRVDIAYWAMFGTKGQLYAVPDEALDVHTGRGRAMGRHPDTPAGDHHWLEQAAKLVNRNEDLGPICEGQPCSHDETLLNGCGAELMYHEEFWSVDHETMDQQGVRTGTQTSQRSGRLFAPPMT